MHNSANTLIAKLDLVYDAAIGTCADPKPYGILDSVDLDIPQKPNKVAVADAKSYLKAQDYLDLKRMLISLELRPMK